MLPTPTTKPSGASDAIRAVTWAVRRARFAVDNVHCGKAEAARWALDRDPSLAAVRQAVHQYAQDGESPIDERYLTDLLDTVLRETATPGTGARSSHA